MAFANAPKSGYTQEDLAQLGPSDVDRMRKMAEALIASGMGGETISDPWQGIAQLVRGLNGQIGNWQAYRAEQKGKQSASDDFGAATVGFPAAPGGGEQASAGGGGNYRDAIAGIESGGRYDAMGPETKGDRAYGKYQIMGANIGPWAQAALGTRMTPQQFLADPKAQDAIFDKIFGGYVQRFGPEGAAQAWFGGPGSVGKTYRSDVLGTNVGEYGKRFIASLGSGGGGGAPAVAQAAPAAPDPVQVASLDPSVGVPQEPAPGGVPVPQPRPEQAAVPPQQPQPQQVQVAQALIGGGGQDPAQTLGAPALSQQQIMTGQQASQRAAMGNEWLNPGQRRLIESLVGQQIEMGDPRTQLDMELKRAQIEAARQRQAPDPFTLGPGDIRYDPSGKEIARGAEKAPNLPSEVEEYNFAKSQGFPGTFMDYQASKKGGMSLTVDPATGAVSFQQGANIKPLTEGQSKDTTYATRMEGALKVLDPYADSLANLPEAAAANVPLIGNFMKSEAYQKAEQAGREFLAALLRKDSGGAITPAEVSEYGATFLPVPGDKKGTLEQKKASRARALAAIKAGMTPQAIMAQEKALAEGAGATAAAPTTGKKTIIDGVEIEELP